MALAALTPQPLTLAAFALLLAGAMATAAILAHSLRKVRSHDWVVASGWGFGGAVAVGTGLWVLQLGLWYAVQTVPNDWFAVRPFVAAWGVAAAVCALALIVARWLPSPAWVNAAMLGLLVPLMVVVFVLLGAATAAPPNWQGLTAGPTLAALGTLAVGLGLALVLLNGPLRAVFAGALGQRLIGTFVFALAWVFGQWLADRKSVV